MNPAELKERAERAWWRSLEARRLGTPFFPWIVPLPRVSSKGDDYEKIARQSEALLSGAKARTGRGYSVVCETRNLRLWGQNSVPIQIVFEAAEDLDAYVGRRQQAATYTRLCTEITTRFPALGGWAAHHARQVFEHEGQWGDLLSVCEYFVATPRPGIYLREIPLPVHTKFIEDHRGILRLLLDQLLPADELGVGGFEARFGLRVPSALVRVRFLDVEVRHRLGFPFEQIGIDRADFAALPLAGVNLLITENEITFLTLPPLANTVGVWGSGFAVASLGNVPSLKEAHIWYWGDLDVQGFQILALLRERAPQTKALFMDPATWRQFKDRAVPGKETRVSPGAYLTLDERELYEELKTDNLRLEQERIPHSWATTQIQAALF